MGKSKDLATGETRFVNTAGDTMTGALTVGGAVTINPDADSSLEIKDGGTNALFMTAATGDELYIGANNEYAFRIKNDGTKDVAFDNGGRVTMPSQPSFLATGPNAWTTVSSGSTSTMTMNSTYYNIGNHYNTSNYTFTCPVAGKYLFHIKSYVKLSTSDDDSNHAYTKIHKNGSLYASSYNIFGYYNLGDNDQNADVTVIMECSANDAITSAVQAASGDALYIPAASYFCGILLG